MPENILKIRVQQKIDTSANWASSTLILRNGEIGIERTANNKIKIKIGDGINTWANLPYATNESSSSSGNGIEYEAGDGISIEDGVISSLYGKTFQQKEIFNCLSLANNTNSTNANENFYYTLENAVEDFHVNQIFILIPFKYFSNIIQPFSIILKKNNTIIKTINLSLAPVTIYANTENEMSLPHAAMGNEYFARALISEGEDTDAINILLDENNSIPTSDWWLAAIINEEDPQGGYYQFMYQAHEDNLPLDVDTVDLELQIETIYKLPTNALTAGNGIKISEDATINLNYGQSDKKIFNTIFNADLDITPPSDYYFGSLYGYYIQQNNFYVMEPNTYPNLFQCYNVQGYTNYNSSLGNINKWSSSAYQETIDYNNNEYKQIPLYYYKNDTVPTEPNIILKEMQHQDNILYNFFEAGLDDANPTMNIFFSGTYNTLQDVNTILSNQAITPDNSNEPALLILFLYQTSSNNAYLLVFTNNTNFDKTAKIAQGTWVYEFDHLPYNVFNGQNNINLESNNDTETFIIGNNNQYRPGNENKTIIIGNNNDMNQMSSGQSAILLGNNLQVAGNNNQIIIGQYNNTSTTSSLTGDKLFIIGNGSSVSPSNILEVTSHGLNVNGAIYSYGNLLESGGNSGIDQTALETYLQNNNYITSSDLNNSLAAVAISGNYNDLSNKPTLATVAASGNYNDLINSPSLATVATSGNYNDLLNKPTLATVATTGSYNDLSSKPTIPTVPTIATSITNTSTNTDTAGAAAVYNFVTNAVAGLSGAMHFIGTTTTALADEAIIEPIVINGNNIYPVAGDVVLNNGNEYVYTGTQWNKLGDESSWVPRLRTINGKALSSNINLTASDVGALADTTTAASLNAPTKPANFTPNHYPILDSNGNLLDSGYSIVISNTVPDDNTSNSIITLVVS